ncbi:MAG: AI-2E family transporter [Mangrovibacterium sp.]
MISIQGKTKTVLITAGILLAMFLIWYFSSIVTYILVAAVLSLIGRPLVRLVQQIRLGKFGVSRTLAAFITLVVMWVFAIGAIRFLIPLLISEFEQLSTVNPESIIAVLEGPLKQLREFSGSENTDEKLTFLEIIKSHFGDKLNFSKLTDLVGFIAGAIGELFIAFFSVSFITFFFLKDENMFTETILLLVPTTYEEKVKKIMGSVYFLLKRYFTGLLAEVVMVGTLVTLGLTIVGIGFHHAVVIGLFCGLFNIIPYLGPWMGATIGLLIGMAISIQADFMSHTLPLLGFMLLVFIIVQVIDNIVFQPLIYSSSVKAHPLEIFLVILAAGSAAGILGMILAIPAYTILRVIAKEFLDNLKIVRKLTQNLNG